MKAGTLNHPKTKRLMRLLDQPLYAAAGILECLWQFAAEYAADGSITKYADELAAWLDWRGDSRQLVDALVSAGFVDEVDGSLLIHDWEDHCPDFVKKRVVRRKNKDLGQETADNGGQRRTSAAVVRTTADNGGQREDLSASRARVTTTTTTTTPNPTTPNQDPTQPKISPPTTEAVADVLVTSGADPPDELTEFEFPCNGTGPKTWILPKKLFAVFKASYPALDISAEMREAVSWCHSNPKERKTAGGMSKFLNGWLSRNQNKTRAGPQGKQKQLPIGPGQTFQEDQAGVRKTF